MACPLRCATCAMVMPRPRRHGTTGCEPSGMGVTQQSRPWQRTRCSDPISTTRLQRISYGRLRRSKTGRVWYATVAGRKQNIKARLRDVLRQRFWLRINEPPPSYNFHFGTHAGKARQCPLEVEAVIGHKQTDVRVSKDQSLLTGRPSHHISTCIAWSAARCDPALDCCRNQTV